MNLLASQKQTLREQTYAYQGRRVRARDDQEVWDGNVHTAIFKMYNQQEPIAWHMELSQYYVLARMRGEFGREEWIHLFV